MALLVFSGVSTATLIKKALFVFIALPVFLATLKTIKFFLFKKALPVFSGNLRKDQCFQKKLCLYSVAILVSFHSLPRYLAIHRRLYL